MSTRLSVASLVLVVQLALASTVESAPLLPDVNPIGTRTPITLQPISEEDGCLQQLDSDGVIVQSPFQVPAGQNFVVTDAAWTIWARPILSDFESFPEVLFKLTALLGEDLFPHLAVTVPSQRVTLASASGSYAFAQGPVFVEGTLVCAIAGAHFGNGEVGVRLSQATRVHGYLTPAK